jgi:hypothetical protein
MGFSVLFVCDADGNAAAVTIEGTLVQDAWVNENYKQYVPSAGQSIISTVLGKTEYLHDLDGDGTKENPYLIKTADDFAKATAILESTYYEVVTTNDSDEVTAVKRWCGISADGMSQIYFQLAPASGDSITVTAPNGALLLSQNGGTYEDTEIVIRQQFAGVLDGNGATINFNGETVTLSGSPNGVIVDYLCGTAIDLDDDDATDITQIARIKNLTIANVTVDAAYAKSGQAAILAGSVDGISTIDGVHIVDAEMDSSVAQIHNKAGLVGKRNGGTLTTIGVAFHRGLSVIFR